MALLNFSQTYEKIQNKIGTPGYLQETDLLFTGDGHIVTHGVDYIPWGNGTIPIEKLPVDNTKVDDKHLWDSATIQNKINNSFLANEAMRFKGSISIEDNSYKINGERTPDGALPKGEVGDTYRVSSVGSYGSNDCEVGDLLICYESGTTKENDRWTVVQTNINGYSAFRVNGTPYSLYTAGSTTPFEIYAPTEPGNANGQILLWDSDRKEAVWAGRDALNIGKSLTTGNGSGLWIGTGNTGDNTGYNGSADKTIRLLQATTGCIGGVIIDKDDLQLDGKPERVTGEGATLNGATISISSTGVIYLTKKNIINALGYTPEGRGVVSWRPIKVNDEDFLDSTSEVSLNIGSVNSTIAFNKNPDNPGKVSFDVNLGYDTINDTSTSELKRVAVKAGSEGTNLGKLYVEIPEYAVVSNEINGLAPQIIPNETDQIDPSYSILASKEGTSAGWYKLNINEINTWRPISIDSLDLENRPLKIVGTENVVFTYDEQKFNSGETATFGIELQWKEWTDNELI